MKPIKIIAERADQKALNMILYDQDVYRSTGFLARQQSYGIEAVIEIGVRIKKVISGEDNETRKSSVR